jgi:phosphopantetheine--protein transferase-like protein
MISLLATLHGPELVGAEAEDAGQPVRLFPDEEAIVQNSVPKRRREFALGRACARQALENMGHPDWVIGRSTNGAPVWPDGIAGSITHTDGYAAALLGSTQHWSGIGIDAERIGRVTRNLWPRLFDTQERDYLAALEEAPQAVAATLLFSAKEACFKAWGGMGPLMFQEIHVTPQGEGFAAIRAGGNLEGRYAIEGELLVTATWIRRSDSI